MKTLQWGLGILASLAIILVLLITSFEVAAYGSYRFYEKEYNKYNVLDDVKMEMSDVMYVTEEMMAYLKGNRENLVVDTIVDGEQREFFNQREKDHMADVQTLFLGGIWLRRIALAITILCLVILVFLKKGWTQIIPRAYQIGTLVFFAITAILGILFASDFTKYFTIFHEIFFTNDLWLLDPATDLLINILPEGFFADMVVRILIIFLISLAITLGGSLFWSQKINKKN